MMIPINSYFSISFFFRSDHTGLTLWVPYVRIIAIMIHGYVIRDMCYVSVIIRRSIEATLMCVMIRDLFLSHSLQ